MDQPLYYRWFSTYQLVLGFLNRQQRLLKITYILFVSLLLFFFNTHWSYDDPYITFRYAENVRQGIGFVYNAGERVQSTTSPLWTILLSLAGIVWSDMPSLAILIGAVSIAFGALFLFELSVNYKVPLVGGLLLFLYPTFSLLISTLGSETPLCLSLIIGAVLAYERKSYYWVALLSALAVLARPDGALIPVILGLHFIFFRRTPIPWRPIMLFLAIELLWFSFAWAYFGSPIPVTLAAKQHQGEMAVSERFLPGLLTILGWYISNPVYVLSAGFMGLGIYKVLRQDRGWSLLLVWTLAYFVSYSILGVSRYYWYYVPLIPGFVVLVAEGVSFMWNVQQLYFNRVLNIFRVSTAVLFILAMMVTQVKDVARSIALPDARIPIYKNIGNWLRQETPATASVGTLEVGTIGYYSQRRMIDFAGLLQPDVAVQLSRDTTYEDAALYAVNRYHPDYLVLHDGIFPVLANGYVKDYCQRVQDFQDANNHLIVYQCDYP